MRALTIRQPWAAAITHADKRVENRTWGTRYRGPLLIHAAKTVNTSALRHDPLAAVVRGLQLDLGAVVAVAQVVDCHEPDGECTPWSMTGQHHLVLDDVTALAEPVPWTGALGLWVPPPGLLERVRVQLTVAAARLLEVQAPDGQEGAR
ncbi:ASCH domain-containing protein [Streptomyces mobaraensis]|uniref:ASCH domain-containing protein n=1 Tax=Streptomyces mobaraensis TaxID=35621 RepID=A0A5N5VZE8_STRMB|nr:ASCH domain-containing protein [Streptomyces mobaraensis]KAB7833551.1 ASCH domain-containing protein [Streptomyces mobaraensis]